MSIKQLINILKVHGVSSDIIENIVSSWSGSDSEQIASIGTDTTNYQHSDTEALSTTFINLDQNSSEESWTLYSDRYTRLECLGRGGMGEVYRVYDKNLRRYVAMKTIQADLITNPAIVSRFIDEAQVIAQLQHPNIIPIYDFGETKEGELFYTMVEVKGFHLDHVIQAVHHAIDKQSWSKTKDGWTFHRLISVFLRTCEAVAFAHDMGVLHRDLKPKNIMIASFDAVFVMDWGIAKVLGTEEQRIIETERSKHHHHQTRFGQITGTPAYMSPEQARGETSTLSIRSDIYSLGAMLHEILFGCPPYSGKNIMSQIRDRAPTLIQHYIKDTQSTQSENLPFRKELLDLPPLPKELITACEKALAYEPDHRFSSVTDLALVVRAWLEGSLNREKALGIVEEALNKDNETSRLQQQADFLYQESQQLLRGINPWESEDKKQQAWEKEDQANLLYEEITLIEAQREQLLQAALTHKANLPEAHTALAHYYQTQHKNQNGGVEQKKIELRLLQHTKALPSQNNQRKQFLTYLKGEGNISLETNPTHAEIWIQSYELQNRRLVLGEASLLGMTPLIQVPLAMGSYRLTLKKQGFDDVYYPVNIAREDHWNSCLQEVSVPVWLPPKDTMSEDLCYVPAGWYESGGDLEVETSLTKRQIWLDGFFMKRFPVTMREYIEFLNDMIDMGHVKEAHNAIPKERDSDRLLLDYKDGKFQIEADKKNLPVHSIDWHSAQRYTQWYSKKVGQLWRLPSEFEWEKAARGVDGRFFPWGNFADPSWGCMRDSHQGSRNVSSIETFPVDESPYGVRGLAGNIIDWTSSLYQKTGTQIQNGCVVDAQENVQVDSEMVYKGGCWYFGSRFMRAADRHSMSANHRGNLIGFRMVCSLNEVIKSDKN